MPSAFQRGVILAPEDPLSVRIPLKPNAEQSGFFTSNPSVPVPDIGFIIDVSRVSTFIPFIILNFDGRQIAVRPNIVRKDEISSLHRISKVPGRLGREFSQQCRCSECGQSAFRRVRGIEIDCI